MRNLEYIAVNIPFFILTGYTYSRSRKKDLPFISFLKHTLISLGVPTLVFFLFFWVIWLVVGRQLSGDMESWYQPLIELSTGSLTTVLATFWFIITLIMMRIIHNLLMRVVPSSEMMLIIGGLLPLLAFVEHLPTIFELHRTLLFFPFFSIGTAIEQHHSKHTPDYNMLLPIIGLVVYLLIGHSFFEGSLHYDWYELMSGGTLMVLIVLLSYVLKPTRSILPLINLLRIGSLVLLATQNYIIGFSRVMLDRITQTPDFLINHIAFKPVVLLLVYLITIPIIYIVKRYCPILLGRGKSTLSSDFR